MWLRCFESELKFNWRDKRARLTKGLRSVSWYTLWAKTNVLSHTIADFTKSSHFRQCWRFLQVGKIFSRIRSIPVITCVAGLRAFWSLRPLQTKGLYYSVGSRGKAGPVIVLEILFLPLNQKSVWIPPPHTSKLLGHFCKSCLASFFPGGCLQCAKWLTLGHQKQ